MAFPAVPIIGTCLHRPQAPTVATQRPSGHGADDQTVHTQGAAAEVGSSSAKNGVGSA